VSVQRMTLEQWRTAIRNNQASFPAQVPRFERQSCPDIQWRVAVLFLVSGWTCGSIAGRYGLSRSRVWQMVRSWTDRAVQLGYVRES
jgi:hypothetical protein